MFIPIDLFNSLTDIRVKRKSIKSILNQTFYYHVSLKHGVILCKCLHQSFSYKNKIKGFNCFNKG